MKKFTLSILATLTIVWCSIMPIMAQSDYGTDIVLKNLSTENQRKPSLAVADNGWLFAAFVTNIGVSSGYEVYKSTDEGISWSSFSSYSSSTEIWHGVKVIVCGAAPYKVFIAKLRSYTSNGFYNLYISEYNGTTGTWAQNPFTYTTNTDYPIHDFDIVADDKYPAVGTSPYGIGLVYSRQSSSRDSIRFVYSTNGGTSFSASKVVTATSSYVGKVSLAYGFSPSYNYGRYNVAWEQKAGSAYRTGRICYSRTSSGITGDFIEPVFVDWESTVTGLCCNPKIACSMGTTNNDSSNVTAVIVFERVGYWNDTDNDIIGYYNNRGSSGNTWKRYSIANSSSNNDKQPDINYDPYFNNFLVTYWDSTHTFLPYCYHGRAFEASPSSWYTLIGNYNDNTTMGSLLQPYPVVEINPIHNMVAHLWSREGTSGNGVILFDAEYSTVGINETIAYGNDKINNIYPNPAYNTANIEIELSKAALVQINIYDMLGKKLSNIYNAQTSPGTNTISFDVSSFANGNYIIEMLSNDTRITKQMMVAHQ